MSERRLMDRLVWALSERRRLWPPDGSSSLACLGLLGWMHLTYSDPEQAVREATGWMWLGGLLDVGQATSESRSDKAHFDARDQYAIEAYGVAVAAQVLQLHSPRRTSEWEVSHDVSWPSEDIEMLMGLGATHGNVMRDVLMGVVRSFEEGRSYVVPMFGERTADDATVTSVGNDDVTDANGGEGVGMVSLLRYVERRDAAAEAADDKPPPLPS
jgi:hypothetical protein